MPDIHIRWFIQRDIPEAVALDRGGPFAWDERDFDSVLKLRHCIAMTAEDQYGRVLGYMAYALYKWRIDLLRVAVHPGHRRQGVGRQLLAKLAAKLESHRRGRLNTVVRESDLAGQLFLRACGLKATKVLRKRFEDTGEDGYRMGLRKQPVREEAAENIFE